MKICFYAPFKPLSHSNPSGDLIIGRGLFDFLSERGHRLVIPSSLRCRWIYWKPLGWGKVAIERRRAFRVVEKFRPDLWVTYHTYYKAPDILGPPVCKNTNTPYIIFQGIFSTKRRRSLVTGPGFLMNRRSLNAARFIFTNRKEDEINLRRIIPAERISYVPPGIVPDDFVFDPKARQALRRDWKVGDCPVILSAAMFRPDVKSEGIARVIEACGEIFRGGEKIFLAIAGDGKEKNRLEKLAAELLPGRFLFTGKVPRNEMYRFYSAGDIFAFPGIRESLGMVYLEAQSCGLPVVAFNNGGIPEVVKDGETGFLTPFLSESQFKDHILKFLQSPGLSKNMGKAAARYVRENHNLAVNYQRFEAALEKLISEPKKTNRMLLK